MAYVIDGKVFVDGVYVGSTEESKVELTDGQVLEVAEEHRPVYVIA